MQRVYRLVNITEDGILVNRTKLVNPIDAGAPCLFPVQR